MNRIQLAVLKSLCLLQMSLALLPFLAYAADPQPQRESDYAALFCTKGIQEYILPNRTRVDCLTETVAYEVDYASKWYQGLGQALYYASQTQRRPGLVLILKDPGKDWKYVTRLYNTLLYYRLDLEVRVMTPKGEVYE